jgi:hypothetical protein
MDGNLSDTGGRGKGQQLTALDSATIQAGFESFIGQSMETDKKAQGTISVMVVDADPHKRAGGLASLYYIGSDDC